MRPIAACFWIAAVTSASVGMGPDTWLTPKALKPGDTIAVIAPAAPATQLEFAAYVKLMERKGYRVISKPGLVGRKEHYLGGTDEERAGEINEYLRDPKVRMIMPVRGGFGVSRILDQIDYDALRRDPKVIAGYSDLTALHLAAARHARVVTCGGRTRRLTPFRPSLSDSRCSRTSTASDKRALLWKLPRGISTPPWWAAGRPAGFWAAT
jgi:muramoyltetrapeptide carboxypeptidase LdcA involved in peptidoglycan recycling